MYTDTQRLGHNTVNRALRNKAGKPEKKQAKACEEILSSACRAPPRRHKIDVPPARPRERPFPSVIPGAAPLRAREQSPAAESK